MPTPAYLAGLTNGFEALGTKLADAFSTGIRVKEAREARRSAETESTRRYDADFGLRKSQFQFQQDQADASRRAREQSDIASALGSVLTLQEAQAAGAAGLGRAPRGGAGAVGASAPGLPKLGTPQDLQVAGPNIFARSPLDVQRVGERLGILSDPSVRTRLTPEQQARVRDLTMRASAALEAPRPDPTGIEQILTELSAIEDAIAGAASRAPSLSPVELNELGRDRLRALGLDEGRVQGMADRIFPLQQQAAQAPGLGAPMAPAAQQGPALPQAAPAAAPQEMSAEQVGAALSQHYGPALQSPGPVNVQRETEAMIQQFLNQPGNERLREDYNELLQLDTGDNVLWKQRAQHELIRIMQGRQGR